MVQEVDRHADVDRALGVPIERRVQESAVRVAALGGAGERAVQDVEGAAQRQHDPGQPEPPDAGQGSCHEGEQRPGHGHLVGRDRQPRQQPGDPLGVAPNPRLKAGREHPARPPFSRRAHAAPPGTRR